MPAIDIFSNGIRFLKDHLISHFQGHISGIRGSDIHWVLTLPAIWDESAKKFMRKSAEMVKRLINSIIVYFFYFYFLFIFVCMCVKFINFV